MTNFKKRFSMVFSFMMVVLLVSATPVFAAPPSIVSNARNLIQDALTWILILVPVTAALMVGWHAWMKSLADGEPGAIAERNKKMRNVIIGSVIAMSAAGIVQLLLSYF